MIVIEEIPIERVREFWDLQLRYLVDDGIVTTEEDRDYFQSPEYRDAIKALRLRTPDTLYMVYFLRDGVRIGASQYCTYKSEDGKCFILDFWVFPAFRGDGTGHECFQALFERTQKDGAKYYALNYAKEDSRRFWSSLGFVDDGTDEYGSPLMIWR